MPHTEPPLSTFAGGNNDRKISCETLIVKLEKPDENEHPQDFPPESIRLPKDAELDWFDRNAFLERKESGKGNGSVSTQVTPNLLSGSNSNSNSSSRRLSLTLKTKTFFGFPKMDDSRKKTCKQTHARFFPAKRSESALKAVSAPEPVSPKVSCIGKVRSKKSRRKCENSIQGSKSSGDKLRTGFYAVVFSMFRFGQRKNKPVKSIREKMNEPIPEQPVKPRMSVSRVSVSVEPGSEPAGLGGMMRFKSGRRSGSWAAEEINVVVSNGEVGPNGRN